MAEETDRAGWGEASQAVAEELRLWQRSHWVATLTEIEMAVEAATTKLQARLIQDLWLEMDQTPMEDPPSTCPACGGLLRRRAPSERSPANRRPAQQSNFGPLRQFCGPARTLDRLAAGGVTETRDPFRLQRPVPVSA